MSVLAPRPRGVGSLYKVRVFGNNLQEVFTTFFIGAKERHRGEFYVRKKKHPRWTRVHRSRLFSKVKIPGVRINRCLEHKL